MLYYILYYIVLYFIYYIALYNISYCIIYHIILHYILYYIALYIILYCIIYYIICVQERCIAPFNALDRAVNALLVFLEHISPYSTETDKKEMDKVDRDSTFKHSWLNI